ncbi:MAG: DMT family transporter [Alphaproteobacteria bacterium]
MGDSNKQQRHIYGKIPIIDYAWLLLLALVWGSSFLFIKIAVVEVPPMTLSASRLLIGALLLGLIAYAGGHRLPKGRRIWGLMLLVAIFGTAMPFFLIAYGQQAIDSGVAAILMTLTPLVTVILAHYFTDDEKWNLYKLIGIAVGFSGVVVLIGIHKLFAIAQTGFDKILIAQLAVLLGAFGYALASLFNRTLSRLTDYNGAPLSFRGIAAGTLLISTLIMLPIALIYDRPFENFVWQDQNLLAWGAVLYLGIGPTAIAHLIMLRVLRAQGASFLSNVNFLVPVIGVGYGVVFLSETPSVNALFGLGMVLSGIYITTRLKK